MFGPEPRGGRGFETLLCSKFMRALRRLSAGDSVRRVVGPANLVRVATEFCTSNNTDYLFIQCTLSIRTSCFFSSRFISRYLSILVFGLFIAIGYIYLLTNFYNK